MLRAFKKLLVSKAERSHKSHGQQVFKMSVLLDVFLVFLKIGLFMFGGGYATIPLAHKEIVESKMWLTDQEFLELLGISEMTPGPIAINTATYVGYKVAGIAGSILATLGTVLPAFLILLSIAIFVRPYLEYQIAKIIFRGISGAIIALIFVAFITISRTSLLRGDAGFNAPVLFIALLAVILLYFFKFHPIEVIIISAVLSLLSFYLLGI
jgi:chromate transporter